MKAKTKTMRMWIWEPKSLGDYTNGMVCVIADSKLEAIQLAVDERWPLRSAKRGMTVPERSAVLRDNHEILSQRSAFRAELTGDKPRIVRRGAVISHGGA